MIWIQMMWMLNDIKCSWYEHQKHEQNCGESELLTLMRTANSWMIPIMYCEDMERYLVVCYAALSANTKCKAGVQSVLSCVASNARLKRALWNRCPEARHVKAKEAASRTLNVVLQLHVVVPTWQSGKWISLVAPNSQLSRPSKSSYHPNHLKIIEVHTHTYI